MAGEIESTKMRLREAKRETEMARLREAGLRDRDGNIWQDQERLGQRETEVEDGKVGDWRLAIGKNARSREAGLITRAAGLMT